MTQGWGPPPGPGYYPPQQGPYGTPPGYGYGPPGPPPPPKPAMGCGTMAAIGLGSLIALGMFGRIIGCLVGHRDHHVEDDERDRDRRDRKDVKVTDDSPQATSEAPDPSKCPKGSVRIDASTGRSVHCTGEPSPAWLTTLVGIASNPNAMKPLKVEHESW